jgi:hypothetical protein
VRDFDTVELPLPEGEKAVAIRMMENRYVLTELSAGRADAVKAWLVGKGIAAGRITTAGYGDTRPLVPNTSDENKARNRRVALRRAGCKD